MTKSMVKWWAYFFIAGLLLSFGVGADEVAAGAGDETVTGVVTKGGFGSFILRSKDGTETTYNTGRATIYQPGDFRPREGDRVKISYYPKDHRGRTILAVSTAELIAANPNIKEPGNPVTGIIKETGRRAFNVYIPEIKKVLKFEKARGTKIIPQGWKPAPDEKVRISHKRVPSRFGRGYVYTIQTFEKIE